MPLLPEQFHTLYDPAAQPVLLVQDGVITQCNPAAQAIAAPGTPFSACFPPDAPLPEPLCSCPAAFPLLVGGQTVQAHAQPLGTDLLVFLPAAESQELPSAVSRAARALSVPLTTILAASDTLFPILADAEDPLLQQNLAVLNRAYYQLLRLSENLNDLSAAQRGQLPLSREKTDLAAFLDELSLSAGDLCRQTGRRLEVHLPQAPVFVQADRRQLRRAILALLSNAIKFTPPGSVLHLSLTRLSKRAAIRLSDSGEGMDAAVLGDVFRRYDRPELPEDPRLGAGFSLPVVQAIAQAHGGFVLLQSRSGDGTDVLFALPVSTPEDQTVLRAPLVHMDRSGGFVPELVALSDVLPPETFDVRNFL